MENLEYLGHVVSGLPVGFVLDGRKLKQKFEEYRKIGVVRVAVGPEEVDVWIDVKRPYVKP